MSKIPLRQRHGASSIRSVLGLLGVMVGCVVTGVVCLTGSALATPPSGFSSTTIGLATFDAIRVVNAGDARVKIETKADVDVHTLFNTFVPGGRIGWHKHPGPSLVTVISGTATFYHGDDPTCTPHVYSANGTNSFVDIGGGAVHLIRDESGAVAQTIAVQLVPAGAMRRQDADDPGNCSF